MRPECLCESRFFILVDWEPLEMIDAIVQARGCGVHWERPVRGNFWLLPTTQICIVIHLKHVICKVLAKFVKLEIILLIQALLLFSQIA